MATIPFAEDHEPVIVKSGAGSSISPLATIRKCSSSSGRCSFSASGPRELLIEDRGQLPDFTFFEN
jgi:hypothetical protein